jgi:hypothetical protein
MRTMIRSTVLLTFAAATLAAQSPFEGAISMSLTSNAGKTTELSYLVKAGKMRFDVTGSRGEQVAMIVDPAAQKTLMVMTSQKMYMEQDFGDAAANAAEKVKPAEVKRTGKTETIAGYKCEHIMVTASDGSTSDVCVASGLGSFRMPQAGGRGGPAKDPEWQSALDKGAFPLKVQKGDKVTLEVTKIERKTLDAALFAPPEGFQKFDMGSMMRKRP